MISATEKNISCLWVVEEIVHCVDRRARERERDVARERANESGIGGTHGGISNGVDRMGGTGGDLSGIWL